MRAVLRTQLAYEAEHKLLNDSVEREREDVHVIGEDSDSRVGDVIITRRVHASSMHS